MMLRHAAVNLSITLFFAGAALPLSGCGKDSGNAAVVTPPKPETFQQGYDKAVQAGDLPALDASATVAGPDANSNGIRDDIDTYINGLSLTAQQKAAQQQLAVSFGQALTVDAANAPAVSGVNLAMGRAVNCAIATLGADAAHAASDKLRKYTVNTRARVDAYARFANALNGSVMEAPDGNTCN